MAISTLIVSCFLFYTTSKHFPVSKQIIEKIHKHKLKLNIIGVVMAAISLVLFTNMFNGVTAFVIWLTALTTILSAVIMSIKLNTKWIYFWSAIVVTEMMMNFM